MHTNDIVYSKTTLSNSQTMHRGLTLPMELLKLQNMVYSILFMDFLCTTRIVYYDFVYLILSLYFCACDQVWFPVSMQAFSGPAFW